MERRRHCGTAHDHHARDEPVRVHPSEPDRVDRLGRHGTCRLADQLGDIQLVDDTLGDAHDVDAIDDGLDVQPGGHRVDVELRCDLVDRDPVDRSLEIHPVHDTIDVQPNHDGVEIDPIRHQGGEVQMIHDGVDDRRKDHVRERTRSEFGFIALPLATLVDPGQPVLEPSRTVRADEGAHDDRRETPGRPHDVSPVRRKERRLARPPPWPLRP